MPSSQALIPCRKIESNNSIQQRVERAETKRYRGLVMKTYIHTQKPLTATFLLYNFVFTMSSLTTYLQETNPKLTPSIGLGPSLRMGLYIFQQNLCLFYQLKNIQLSSLIYFTYSLKSSLYLKDNLRLVALFSISGYTCVCVHTKVAFACHSKQLCVCGWHI